MIICSNTGAYYVDVWLNGIFKDSAKELDVGQKIAILGYGVGAVLPVLQVQTTCFQCTTQRASTFAAAYL